VPFSKPVIAVGNFPAWSNGTETLLHPAGFDLVHCSDPAHLVGRLVDDFPALLLLDGDDPHWKFWVTATRTDQATRRLPIVVVAHDEAVRQDALAAGAQAFIQVDQLGAQLVPALREHAHFPDQAVLDDLLCQCEDDLPPLARLGVQKFNARDYYAQHAAFKKQWTIEAGPVRDLYRSILQVGVAYLQIGQGNAVGALRVLRRSAQWFSVLPDVCQGVNVRRLREDADRVYLALQAAELTNTESLDLELLRPIPFVDE
jgi:CheY-like chemotaxis protein